VGAGTGSLYDFLLSKNIQSDYFATDITEKMLEQSKIPLERRFYGSLLDSNFPIQEFDYIFLLGVTSYMSPIEMEFTIDWAKY